MAKKRVNNSGSVSKDNKQGGYRAFITMPDGHRTSKRFPESETAEDEAHDWLNEKLYEISKGLYVAPNNMTLGEWLRDYLEIYSKPNIRQRSFDRNKSIAEHCEPLYEVIIQDLRPTMIQKLYQDIPLSGETKRKIHVLLNQAMKQAVRERIIQYNPMDGVVSPRPDHEEVEIIDKEYLESIMTVSQEHPWYAALHLTVHTGIRMSELLGLSWEDVSLTENYIHIKKTLHKASTGIIFEDPKTKSSKRKISIPEKTTEILKQHHKLAMANLSKTNNKRNLCFINEDGTPINPRRFARWWEHIQQIANPEWCQLEKKRTEYRGDKIKKEYVDLIEQQKKVFKAAYKTFHVIRHTHATELLASGMPIVDVSRRLGHANPSITLNIYGHVIPANDQKVVEQVGKLYKF
jgi:integrase